MDQKQAAYAALMQEWDRLDPEVREQFRKLDLDFHYPLWLQCDMLNNNTRDKIAMYKRFYDKI